MSGSRWLILFFEMTVPSSTRKLLWDFESSRRCLVVSSTFLKFPGTPRIWSWRASSPSIEGLIVNMDSGEFLLIISRIFFVDFSILMGARAFVGMW